MNSGSWLKRLLLLVVYALLPFVFVHLTYLLFRIPVFHIIISISALVSGVGVTFVINTLIRSFFNAKTGFDADRIKKNLLYLAIITGFGYPLVLFMVAGLIYMARAGMPLSKGPEMGWVSFVAGAAWGWPLWIFSVPWAFVMVYGLARSSGPQKAAVFTAEDAEER